MRTILEVKEEIKSIDVSTKEGFRKAIEMAKNLSDNEGKKAIINDVLNRSNKARKERLRKIERESQSPELIANKEKFYNKVRKLTGMPESLSQEEIANKFLAMPQNDEKLAVFKQALQD